MKLKKFEIPYNFDPKLLAGLNILKFPYDNISSIYLPPYEFDYPSVRRNDIMPNEKEHLNQIKMIQNQFPGKIRLLLQQTDNNYLMTGKLLNKYLNLGITKFCVGSLNQAKEIKDILPKAEIIGSITMNINKEKIENNKEKYLQYFNSFVLNYTYNKDLEKVQQLPNYYKYIFIINSNCVNQCEGNNYCFDSKYNNFKCPYDNVKNDFIYKSKISPIALSQFNNYSYSYKIVERGDSTEAILYNLIAYSFYFNQFQDIKLDNSFYYKNKE